MSMRSIPKFTIMNIIRRNCAHYGIRQMVTGFTLLEVLVALVVLAIGMLGIAALLLTTEKSNSSSYVKQQAIQSAYDMLDRMRANHVQALAGAYNASNLAGAGAVPAVAAAPSSDCNSSVCTPAQLTAYDIWHWQSAMQNQLPNGCGSIVTAAAGASTMITVTVQWDDGAASQTLGMASKTAAGGSLAQYTIQTLL